jgi:hypothetical protein
MSVQVGPEYAISTSLTSTGNVLGAINYSGTHNFTIASLVDSVANLSITNANTGTSGVFTVTSHTDNSLATLSLIGSVAYTGVSTSTAAITVLGSTDHQNVSLTFAGATGVKTITLGNGANTIVTGAVADVITLGTGGNTVTGAAAGDTITLGAGTVVSTMIYSAVSETIAGSVTSGTTVLSAAAGADIYTGLQVGDVISLAALTTTAYTAGSLSTTINAGGGDIDIVRGNWVASTGIFSTSATGTDSIVQWDNDGSGTGTTIETVVLVGFVNTASTTTTDGVITLA